jgi:hypothetical protein
MVEKWFFKEIRQKKTAKTVVRRFIREALASGLLQALASRPPGTENQK